MQMPTDNYVQQVQKRKMFPAGKHFQPGSSPNRMHHTPVSSSLRVKQNAIKGARYSYVTINKPITEYQTNLI